MSEAKKRPQIIEDEALDEASGGIGMLLPAVQKAREAEKTSESPTGVSGTEKWFDIDRTA